MIALAVSLHRLPFGWAIMLSDGSELSRFTGLRAKRRALRYLAGQHIGIHHPRIASRNARDD